MLQGGLQDILTHLWGHVQYIPGRFPQRHPKLRNIKLGQPSSSGSRWPCAHLWLLQLFKEANFPPPPGGQHRIFIIQGQLSLLLPKNKKAVSLWQQQSLQGSGCVQPQKLRYIECKVVVTEQHPYKFFVLRWVAKGHHIFCQKPSILLQHPHQLGHLLLRTWTYHLLSLLQQFEDSFPGHR